MQEKAWTAQQPNGIQLPVYRHSWQVVGCLAAEQTAPR